jgi:hypothetical protein
MIFEMDDDMSGEINKFEFCEYMLVNMGKADQADLQMVETQPRI